MALRRSACLFSNLDRRRRGAVAALLAFISVAGPLPARSGETQPIDSSRIVSIGGAVTETIYALGLEGRIVGVDTTSLYPPEALKRAPNVGYMRALSAEGILSLKPSLVIAIDGSGPPAALKLVSETGVPLTMVNDDPSPDGVAAKIEAIGKMLGADEKAVTLASETRARFALVEHMRPQTPKPPRVLFILSLQNGRPMVGGRGTAADAMIRLARGANAAEDIEGYKPMTDEGIIAAAPDVILKMNNGNMVGAPDDIFSLPAFAATPAAANRALIAMDGLYLLGFGLRSPDAVRELMADLYPSLTLPPLPTLADRQ
jgi:iron complex transport system substrate-binding protein